MIGSIATKAMSPSTLAAACRAPLPSWPPHRRLRVGSIRPGKDRVETAAAERQRGDEPEDQAELALLGFAGRAAASAISAASVIGRPDG